MFLGLGVQGFKVSGFRIYNWYVQPVYHRIRKITGLIHV